MTDITKIVVPTDFSEGSRAALAWALRLSKDGNAEVHCVHAIQEPAVYVPMMPPGATASFPDIDELREISQENLTIFIDSHMQAFSPTPIAITLVGRPADVIVEYAKDIDAQMIVIATRGHSALAHALLGSTAEAVVRHAHCAVLTVREEASLTHQTSSDTYRLDYKLHELAEDLAQSRDELKLKMKLASNEMRDEWGDIEKRWDHFRQQLTRAKHEAADSGEDIGDALAHLGKELKKSYDRIRKAL